MKIVRYIFLISILVSLGVSQGWAQFNPSNPIEPSMKYKVKVTSDPTDISYLNGAGEYLDGNSVWIKTSSRYSQYKFVNWTLDGEVYSTNTSFLYTVERKDVNFVAHYKYVPESPSEPTVRYMKRVYLQSSPTGVATFNYSSGNKFEVGSSQYMVTYPSSGYTFLGWYNGDELISSSTRFYYTIPDKDVTLEARFKFDPTSPDDPTAFTFTSCNLKAASNNETLGTVSVDGLVNERAVFGSTVALKASPTDGNVFRCWNDGKKIVSTDANYSFMVTDDMKGLKFTAMFMTDPKGDADHDGKLNVADITSVVNKLKGANPEWFDTDAADVNNSGNIDVNDINGIRTKVLKAQ